MNQEIDFKPIQTTPFKFSTKVKSHLWIIVNKTIFRLFPNQLKKPRIILLRVFGAKIDYNVNISRTALIEHPWNLEMGYLSSLGDNSWIYCLNNITIGKKCCIGKDVYLITGSHEVNDLSFNLITKPIKINDGCWVATGACILPGINIGEYSVIAAKSVVIKDVEPFTIVGGNPAKFIKKREITK